MDPLSDVLALLRVRSFKAARVEFRGAWAHRYCAQPPMKFAGVLEGALWLWFADGRPALRIQAGDFYLMTRGQAYCAGSDPSLVLTDGRASLNDDIDPDGVVRIGPAGGARVSAAGGRFVLDDRMASLLLPLLPPVIHIPADADAAVALRPVLELLRHEAEGARPGRSVAALSVANLVLLQVVRARLLAERPEAGWLGALMDPKVGSALRSMHEDVAYPWSVMRLASKAGMSRTSFAERFKALVGMPPLTYLLRWRMALASAALERGERLSAIALEVGYSSETAFSAAYQRTTGCRPGRYRDANKHPQGVSIAGA